MSSKIQRKKYRIKLQYGTSSVYVTPTGTIQVGWELIDGTYYYAETVGSFKLSGDDYNWVKDIETAGDICGEIRVTVERRCDNQWQIYKRSKFTVQNCTWNNSKCNVIVNPEPLSIGECLLSRSGDSLDLFDEVLDFPATPGVDGLAYMSDAITTDLLGYDNGRVFLYNDPAIWPVLIRNAEDGSGNPSPEPTISEVMEAGGIPEVERELIQITFIGSVQSGVLAPKYNIYVAWAYRRGGIPCNW